MSLSAEDIKKKLAKTSWITRDNVAQNIINSLSEAELKSLDAESVLRLHRELIQGVYSRNDNAAWIKRQKLSQFQPLLNSISFAIDLLKNSSITRLRVKSALQEKLIRNIYAAEAKRMDWSNNLGIYVKSLGRGQLRQIAYEDVLRVYLTEYKVVLTRVYMSKFLKFRQPRHPEAFRFEPHSLQVVVPTHYRSVYSEPDLENFVVSAYLAIKFNASFRNQARSIDDAKKFGVGVYHGMYSTLKAAQDRLNNLAAC